MERLRWLLNRLAAALAGATLVGLFAATILQIINALTCGPTCSSIAGTKTGTHYIAYGSSCTELWTPLLGSFIVVIAVSIVCGTMPGIVAVTLTPARKEPWRALPVLVFGTLLGFAIWLSVVTRFSLQGDVKSLFFLFLFPTLTGLATALNIDRLPPRRNRALI